jgi:hypothetical protein
MIERIHAGPPQGVARRDRSNGILLKLRRAFNSFQSGNAAARCARGRLLWRCARFLDRSLVNAHEGRLTRGAASTLGCERGGLCSWRTRRAAVHHGPVMAAQFTRRYVTRQKTGRAIPSARSITFPGRHQRLAETNPWRTATGRRAFRKTSGSPIVLWGHRDGFFASGAKLGFGWPSSAPIVVWQRKKGHQHGIQA